MKLSNSSKISESQHWSIRRMFAVVWSKSKPWTEYLLVSHLKWIFLSVTHGVSSSIPHSVKGLYSYPLKNNWEETWINTHNRFSD